MTKEFIREIAKTEIRSARAKTVFELLKAYSPDSSAPGDRILMEVIEEITNRPTSECSIESAIKTVLDE